MHKGQISLGLPDLSKGNLTVIYDISEYKERTASRRGLHEYQVQDQVWHWASRNIQMR